MAIMAGSGGEGIVLETDYPPTVIGTTEFRQLPKMATLLPFSKTFAITLLRYVNP